MRRIIHSANSEPAMSIKQPLHLSFGELFVRRAFYDFISARLLMA